MKSIRQAIGDTLFLSLSSDQIRRLVPKLIKGFDMYSATGFDPGIRIPKAVALDCALDQFPDDGSLLEFLAYVMKQDGLSLGGEMVRMRGKDELLSTLELAAWRYDGEHNRFVKDQSVRTTLDFGFMREDKEYSLTFASLDLVASSALAERLSTKVLERTFLEFREYIRTYVEIWNGRQWTWAGDGGLLAFQGLDSQKRCVIAMVSCLMNLPVFILRKARLPGDVSLQMRIGIHQGQVLFKKDIRTIFSPAIQRAEDVQETDCPPNGIALSEEVHSQLSKDLGSHFHSMVAPGRKQVWLYGGSHGG